MAKKSIALFLTSLVILQLGAVWAVFSCALWFHQQHKQIRLADKSRWEVFMFRADEIQSIQAENDEMEIGGKLYDVVSIQSLDNQITITAVADHAEDNLKRTLDGLSQKESEWSDLAKLASSFGASFFMPEKVVQISAVIPDAQTIYITYQDNNVYCGVRRKTLEPPCL